MAGSSCEHKVPLKEKICCRVLTIELVNLLLEIGLNLRVRLIMPKNSVAFRNNKKKKKKTHTFSRIITTSYSRIIIWLCTFFMKSNFKVKMK